MAFFSSAAVLFGTSIMMTLLAMLILAQKLYGQDFYFTTTKKSS